MKLRRSYWLLWLLATLGLYFFENNTGTRIIFAASVLLPCLSLVCAFLCAERLHFELTAPAAVPEGQELLCHIKAKGPFWTAFCMPAAGIWIRNTVSGETYTSPSFLLEEKKTLRFRAGAPGTFLISLTDTALEDRFGLFHLPISCRAEMQLRVFFKEDGIMRENSEIDPSAYSGIREYVPGDPIRRIHWKLSAKTGRILIREPEKIPEEEPFPAGSASRAAVDPETPTAGNAMPQLQPDPKPRARLIQIIRRFAPAALLLSMILLILIPHARYGAEAICNRIFAASEAANAYAYQYFDVPADQPQTAASLLFGLAAVSLTGIILSSFNPPVILLTAALSAGSQAYFGLSLPAYLNIFLFAVAGWLLLRGKHSIRTLLFYLSGLLVIILLIGTQYPGVDPWIENRSEALRDRLTAAADLPAVAGMNSDEEKTPIRHINSRSLINGEREAETGREFQPVTQEKEQIALPQWAESLSSILPWILTAAAAAAAAVWIARLVKLRKRAADHRKRFRSRDNREAICAMFRHTARWLEFFGYGAGNLPYRSWPEFLTLRMTEDYAEKFAGCAAYFEEALYSGHEPEAEKVEAVRSLLTHTEELLYSRADRQQRFRLKFTEGLL